MQLIAFVRSVLIGLVKWHNPGQCVAKEGYHQGSVLNGNECMAKADKVFVSVSTYVPVMS